MAPARILACQPQHHGPHLGRHGRASSLTGRLPPLPAHERPMPTQQRPRSDQTRAARGAWQMAGRRREQGPISGAKLRPRDLAAQHLELVAQDQQLEVLDVQATTTPNECAQQGPERDVEEGEGHYRRSSQPAREGARHEYWRPSRVLNEMAQRLARPEQRDPDLIRRLLPVLSPLVVVRHSAGTWHRSQSCLRSRSTGASASDGRSSGSSTAWCTGLRRGAAISPRGRAHRARAAPGGSTPTLRPDRGGAAADASSPRCAVSGTLAQCH